MKKWIFAAVLMLLVVGSSACSMKNAVNRIGLTLKKVHVTEIRKDGFEATLYMQVDNPNWFGMTVSDFHYQAFVDGRELARGESDKEIRIPGEGQAMAELPVQVTYCDIQDKMYELLRGRLSYRVTGEVGFKTWIGRYTLPFDTGKEAGSAPAEGKPSGEGAI